MTAYNETGGMRWGSSYWRSANASWPLVTLTASEGHIDLRLRFRGILPGLWNDEWGEFFHLTTAEITAIRRLRALFSRGVVIEHRRPDLPSFILFWSFRCRRLEAALTRLGYSVVE